MSASPKQWLKVSHMLEQQVLQSKKSGEARVCRYVGARLFVGGIHVSV